MLPHNLRIYGHANVIWSFDDPKLVLSATPDTRLFLQALHGDSPSTTFFIDTERFSVTSSKYRVFNNRWVITIRPDGHRNRS